MKILLVAQEAHPNAGVPGYVNCLAGALADGHDVTVLSAGRAEFGASGVHHIRVPALPRPRFVFGLTFWLLAGLVLIWMRVRRNGRYDVIHSHYSLLDVLADISTYHYCEEEGLRAMQRAGRDGLGDNFLSVQRSRRSAWVEARTCGRQRRKPMIVPSRSVRDQFHRHHATPVRRVVVIPNGVDTEKYHPRNIGQLRGGVRRRHGIPERNLMVLMMGAEWVRKGVPQAIRAVASLDDVPVTLLVVGPDTPDRYLALAMRHGAADRVVFAGPTKSPEMYHAAADVFLLASLYEPFGLVVTEAMATGLPVVVSASAGVAELIQDGVNGLLIDDPDDAGEIATALQSLVRDGAVRERLGYEARRTACENDWRRVADSNLEVYQAVVADRRNR